MIAMMDQAELQLTWTRSYGACPPKSAELAIDSKDVLPEISSTRATNVEDPKCADGEVNEGFGDTNMKQEATRQVIALCGQVYRYCCVYTVTLFLFVCLLSFYSHSRLMTYPHHPTQLLARHCC